MSANDLFPFDILCQMKLTPGIDYIGISTPFYCVDGKGHLLMHKRSKNCRDEKGRWDTGAGQLHFGEKTEEGVLREVKEEYGCRGEILERVPAYSVLRTQNGIKTHWLAIPFVIKVDPEEVKNNEPEKIDEIGWFTLDNLPKPLHSAFRRYELTEERIKYIKKYI